MTFQFNVAKGQIKTFFNNVETATPANSAIIVVPIEFTSVEADETLRDHDTLAAVLAGSSNEQLTMGRQDLLAADLSLVVSDTVSENWLTIDMVTDITWPAATGNRIAKLLFCYDADTTTGSDTNITPLLSYDFDVTPSGIDIIVSAHANGLIRVT